MEASHQSFIDSLKDERIGGRYVVERVLRAGGMGAVVAGRYPELDQEVAIKFMLPELASHEILSVRFLREARLAARVKSPHFVRIFDFGRLGTSGSSVNASSGVPYLVMEMLSGRDLRDELEARGRLPVAEAIDYVLQAAVGIAEIHSLGFVHRDLKPSNLFLARAAGTLTVKVLNFGISKEAKQEGAQGLTSTGHMIGTAQYMAPEQIRESKIADVRSDVWALGVILYELMTLSLPFGADSNGVGEIMGLILHTEPVPPKKHVPEMPDGLQAVILKCLQREADNRYADVGALADALRPFAAPASLPRIDTIHHALASRPASPVDAGPDKSTPPERSKPLDRRRAYGRGADHRGRQPRGEKGERAAPGRRGGSVVAQRAARNVDDLDRSRPRASAQAVFAANDHVGRGRSCGRRGHRRRRLRVLVEDQRSRRERPGDAGDGPGPLVRDPSSPNRRRDQSHGSRGRVDGHATGAAFAADRQRPDSAFHGSPRGRGDGSSSWPRTFIARSRGTGHRHASRPRAIGRDGLRSAPRGGGTRQHGSLSQSARPQVEREQEGGDPRSPLPATGRPPQRCLRAPRP